MGWAPRERRCPGCLASALPPERQATCQRGRPARRDERRPGRRLRRRATGRACVRTPWRPRGAVRIVVSERVGVVRHRVDEFRAVVVAECGEVAAHELGTPQSDRVVQGRRCPGVVLPGYPLSPRLQCLLGGLVGASGCGRGPDQSAADPDRDPRFGRAETGCPRRLEPRQDRRAGRAPWPATRGPVAPTRTDPTRASDGEPRSRPATPPRVDRRDRAPWRRRSARSSAAPIPTSGRCRRSQLHCLIDPSGRTPDTELHDPDLVLGERHLDPGGPRRRVRSREHLVELPAVRGHRQRQREVHVGRGSGRNRSSAVGDHRPSGRLGVDEVAPDRRDQAPLGVQTSPREIVDPAGSLGEHPDRVGDPTESERQVVGAGRRELSTAGGGVRFGPREDPPPPRRSGAAG
jgi:hypothetical protein